MKSFLSITTATIITLSSSAFAADSTGMSTTQTDSRYDASEKVIPRINVVGGISSSKVNVNNEANSLDRKTNAAGSITADLGLGASPIVLETGGAYRSLGVKSGNASINLNYLGVPVLAKLYLGNPMGFAGFVRAGVRPSWAVSKNVESTIGTVTVGKDFDSGINTFDLPAVAGVGAKIGMGNQVAFLLSADYEYSILKINSVGGDDLRNAAYVFQGGVAIGL